MQPDQRRQARQEAAGRARALRLDRAAGLALSDASGVRQTPSGCPRLDVERWLDDTPHATAGDAARRFGFASVAAWFRWYHGK